MKVLIVFCHFSNSSLTHHVYKHTIEYLSQKGHSVKARNLHKIGFNPVVSSKDLENSAMSNPVAEDVATEQAYVDWADALIFIYPIWWWERPAMLKGWFDRVFTKGFAFDYTDQGLEGLLKNKKGFGIQLIGTPQSNPLALEKSYMFQNSLIEGTLGFCGIKEVDLLTIYNTLYMKPLDVVLKTAQIDTFLDRNF